MGAKYIRYLAILILAVGASDCGTVGGPPIYPESWSPLAELDTGRTCPDISGRYQAVSEEAGPLVYPPGRHPREFMFFIVDNISKPPPPRPPRGRRILPWHLAGIFQDQDPDEWNALAHYAATLKADSADSAPKDDAGWVQVSQRSDSVIEVRAGLHDQTVLNLVLRKGKQHFFSFSNKSHIYDCYGGKLTTRGSYPPPSVENPFGSTSNVIADFTFFRAVDGSLVMMEEIFSGPRRERVYHVVTGEWWHWRRIE